MSADMTFSSLSGWGGMKAHRNIRLIGCPCRYPCIKYANQHLPFPKSASNMRIMQIRNVSTVLRALLDRHGISPTELHRRTGVPQSTLSRILSGKIVDPSDKHISKIAEYFRVSTDQLRGRAAVGVSRDDGRDPMHSELKDISLWDDDTPVNDDEVSIPFLREVELAAG